MSGMYDLYFAAAQRLTDKVLAGWGPATELEPETASEDSGGELSVVGEAGLEHAGAGEAA